MKLGKELKLDLLENFKTKIGTVNNKESKSIYINLSAWGELNDHNEELNYDTIISSLRKKIKQNLNSTINKEFFYDDRYIVDLDMRTSGFNPSKRSFMSCEITLYQKKGLPINQPNILESSKDVIFNVVNNCLRNNNHFTFFKTKK
jgi:hypothetical protein